MSIGQRCVKIGGQIFIIDIKSTQNKSYQGTILWTQTQQKIAFRSALELICLINSAVSVEKEGLPQFCLGLV